ncbi:MAG: hypothetical protein ACJ71Q_08900 [Terriglobales bacterium]
MSITHVANGQESTIDVIRTANGFHVRTFRDGKQIGVTYSASYEIAHQLDVAGAHLVGTNAVEALVNCAKGDLDSGGTK